MEAGNSRSSLEVIAGEIVECRACARLVEWREKVAREKRRAFKDDTYWGRPIPGFGDPGARILILGLAPAAHGGNRTGRVFTGDRSGDWLFAALYRAGLSSSPESLNATDGLRLFDTYITASVKCAPPDNKPLPIERTRCAPFLHRELDALSAVTVLVCLGGYAWENALKVLAERGVELPRPKPTFSHGAVARAGPYTMVGSYHPSQQNTFTGRLTEPMLDDVFRAAKRATE